MWLVVTCHDVNGLIRSEARRSGRICGEAQSLQCHVDTRCQSGLRGNFLTHGGTDDLAQFSQTNSEQDGSEFQMEGTLLGLPKIIRWDTQQNRVPAASQYIEAPNVNAHRREADGE